MILAATFAVTKAGDTTGGISVPSAPSSSATTPATSTTPAKTTPAKPVKPKQPVVTAGAGLPAPVARALNRGKVVVLFFYEPPASDDQATRAAVRAVRAGAGGSASRVSLFQDVVARISDYRRVVGSLGISQSPALVVIDKNRKAQLLQGYVDSGTIEQTVRDAL